MRIDTPNPGRPARLVAHILQGTGHAGRLAARHQRLNRFDAIVAAIRSLLQGDAAPLDRLRSLIERSGAFLMTYTPEAIAPRLSSPLWVVAEAQAVVCSRTVLGGDCQVQLPPDEADAQPLVPLPESDRECGAGSEVIEAIEAIRRRPAVAACVADLGADDAVAGRGYAGAAKHAAFEEVRRRNRARQFPIRYILGEVFQIRGLRLPDGTQVLLSDFGQPPLVNAASMRANQRSARHPASLGWVVRDRNNMPPNQDGVSLLTDWQILVRSLDR
jgi:hypothetical protein